MKKNEEMISLNSSNLDFKEEMSLDEMLERLNPMELKSVKAGANACLQNCNCNTMDHCGTRCDGNCAPDCEWDGFDDFCVGMDDDCHSMSPT